jgi:hypothetical protein
MKIHSGGQSTAAVGMLMIVIAIIFSDYTAIIILWFVGGAFGPSIYIAHDVFLLSDLMQMDSVGQNIYSVSPAVLHSH